MNKKLKKIEINDFRVYQNRQVFDFMYHEKEVANLVLIYGPNGFGKTSFCDAVEWGLTGIIRRISNNALLEKTAEYEKGYILKNRNSPSENGEIIFEAENGDKLIRKTTKLNKKTKKDYQKGSREFEGSTFKIDNEENIFSKYILAHDQIDSFLKAVTPEDRYKKLIDFWGGKDDSILYERLIKVCKISKNEIENQIKIIKKISDEISEFVSVNNGILSLNKCINKLNLLDISENSLKIIKEEFKEDDIRNLRDNVILKKTKLNEENKNLQIAKCELEELKKGYKLNLDKNLQYKKNELDIENISKNIRNFQNIKAINTDIEELNKKIEIECQQIDALRFLYDNWNRYRDLELAISKFEKDIHILEKNILERDIKIKDNNIEIKRNEVIISKNKESIKVYKEKLQGIYNLRKILDNNSALESKIKKIKNIIDLRNSKILICRIEEKSLRTYMDSIEKDYEINKINIKYSEKYKELKNIENKIKETEKELEICKDKYNDLSKLKNELKSVIYSGRIYIEKTKDHVCPLCNADYENYSNLISRINEKIGDKIELDKLDLKLKRLEQLNSQYIMFKKNIKIEICEKIKKDLQECSIQKETYINKNIRTEEKLNLYNKQSTEYSKKIKVFSDIYNEEEINIIKEKINIESLKNQLESKILKKINEVSDLTSEIERKREIEKNLKDEKSEFQNKIKLQSCEMKRIVNDSIIQKYKQISLDYKINLNKNNIIDKIKLLYERLEKYSKEKEAKNII